MIMMEKTDKNNQTDNSRPASPDLLENNTSIVESHIVIKDPESGEIIMSRRD